MPKRVLSVGQCVPDNLAIKGYLDRHFSVEFETAIHARDTLATMRDREFDLILINRKLDADYSDGVEIIKDIKADARLTNVAVMLVTNYPEAQDAAVSLGAERGFGKLDFEKPETLERLRRVLG